MYIAIISPIEIFLEKGDISYRIVSYRIRKSYISTSLLLVSSVENIYGYCVHITTISVASHRYSGDLVTDMSIIF